MKSNPSPKTARFTGSDQNFGLSGRYGSPSRRMRRTTRAVEKSACASCKRTPPRWSSSRCRGLVAHTTGTYRLHVDSRDIGKPSRARPTGSTWRGNTARGFPVHFLVVPVEGVQSTRLGRRQDDMSRQDVFLLKQFFFCGCI